MKAGVAWTPKVAAISSLSIADEHRYLSLRIFDRWPHSPEALSGMGTIYGVLKGTIKMSRCEIRGINSVAVGV